jgi:peptidoglycan-associated lipoprotein
MKQQIRVLGVALLVCAFAVSCSSKKKKDDAQATDPSAMDASVASKDINLDPLGSDGGNINGLRSVNFDYDSATLSSEMRRVLADNAEWIRSNDRFTVQIEGHCDSRGSVEYNLALGERRAKAVKNYMVSLGLDSKRLTIISYGEEKPLVAGDSEDAYAKNRRANFVPLAQ